MKFGHMILRIIIKFVTTICQILRLKCTKFNFSWRSPGRGGKGEEWKGEEGRVRRRGGEWDGGKEGEMTGGKGMGRWREGRGNKEGS